MFNWTKDVQRQPSIRHEHSPDLSQCTLPIREELQSQLAEGDVEGCIWKWQIEHAAFMPTDSGAGHGWERPGDRQHSRIDIQFIYSSVSSHGCCCPACHHS